MSIKKAIPHSNDQYAINKILKKEYFNVNFCKNGKVNYGLVDLTLLLQFTGECSMRKYYGRTDL